MLQVRSSGRRVLCACGCAGTAAGSLACCGQSAAETYCASSETHVSMVLLLLCETRYVEPPNALEVQGSLSIFRSHSNNATESQLGEPAAHPAAQGPRSIHRLKFMELSLVVKLKRVHRCLQEQSRNKLPVTEIGLFRNVAVTLNFGSLLLYPIQRRQVCQCQAVCICSNSNLHFWT